MSSVKVVLRISKLNDAGNAPLYIRIIQDRRTKFISTGISLRPIDWNDKTFKVKKSHPNSARINALLSQKTADAEALSLELIQRSENIHSVSIKARLGLQGRISFLNYADAYALRLSDGDKIGTYKRVKSVVKKIRLFKNKQDLFFEDITVSFLKKYEDYLLTSLKNTPNTIHANFKIIKKLVNDAIAEGIVDAKQNPFLRYKIKTTSTEKPYLTEEELSKLELLNLNADSHLFHHRNMYVFAAYAGGLRISDIIQLKWSNFDGERLHLRIQKTNTPHILKLPNKAIEIIELYRDDQLQEFHNQYIFPALKSLTRTSTALQMHNAISSANAYINKSLKTVCKMAEITKKISFHSSRHTWATRALRKGMRIEYVSKLMGHSTIKQTQVYTKIVNEELDNAMDIFNS